MKVGGFLMCLLLCPGLLHGESEEQSLGNRRLIHLNEVHRVVESHAELQAALLQCDQIAIELFLLDEVSKGSSVTVTFSSEEDRQIFAQALKPNAEPIILGAAQDHPEHLARMELTHFQDMDPLRPPNDPENKTTVWHCKLAWDQAPAEWKQLLADRLNAAVGLQKPSPD